MLTDLRTFIPNMLISLLLIAVGGVLIWYPFNYNPKFEGGFFIIFTMIGSMILGIVFIIWGIKLVIHSFTNRILLGR